MKQRITRTEIEQYKREILDQTVLVGLTEAAAILSMHPRTLQRRVEENRIPHYSDNKTKKGTKFLASELRDYVRGMRIDISAERGNVGR